MLPAEVIAHKRDGKALSREEIRFLVKGLADGSLSDAQAGSFAMAVYLRGLQDQERVYLTEAMRDSGDVLEWDLPGPVVDKHSTGGVGDTVSMIAAPVLAACGAYVPMISGRGLGHTGGTLDKFDAIPGYVTQPDIDTLRRVTRDVGCAIIGQTGDIAPADKRLYAIRDVTATTTTLDLITPSILSKKLAAGLDALMLDVKVGSGAFLPSMEDARRLARALVSVANGAGCKASALITDMNQPLSTSVGNALEMAKIADVLTGKAEEPRMSEVTRVQCADLLQLCGLATTRAEGTTMVRNVLESGQAAEIFDRMVSALGGPVGFLENHEKHLARASLVEDVFPESEGIVTKIDTRDVGIALIELGGGRVRESDKIDMGVGFERMAELGARVDPKTPLARIHANSPEAMDRAKQRIRAVYHLGDSDPKLPLIVERIS